MVDAQPAETGVYRRADVEGFAEWARTAIAHLQAEVVDANRRATAAEQALAERDSLDGLFDRAARLAADAAAQAAATAAADRVEALLHDLQALRQSTPQAHEDDARAKAQRRRQSAGDGGRDPLLDPLPAWNDQLLAFPEEASALPPIGAIFDNDTHRSA
jgi:hypothetical protein